MHLVRCRSVQDDNRPVSILVPDCSGAWRQDGQLEAEIATIFTTLAAGLDGIPYTVRTEMFPPPGEGVGSNAADGD